MYLRASKSFASVSNLAGFNAFRTQSRGCYSIFFKQENLFHNRHDLGCKSHPTLAEQTRTMTDANTKLDVQLLSRKDTPAALTFLKMNFFADEPLTKHVKLLDNPKSVEALSVFSMKSIDQNYSLLVRNETGEIAGVCLNSLKTKNDLGDEPESDPIFGKICRLLAFAYEEAKVFEKFPDIEKILSVDIISVGRDFQGYGIAKILMDRTREIARKNSIKMLRVDCTSHFSARASEKLGMQCVYELKYEDYKENGEQVFKPDPPHTGLKVYVQRLDS